MKSNRKIPWEYLKHLFQYGMWGIPGFLLAYLLNYFFVELSLVDVYFSYGLVLVIVTVLNFFIVDKIVFRKEEKTVTQSSRIVGYVMVTTGSRFLEWVLYSLLIYYFSVYFLLSQIISNVSFIVIKFLFFRKIMV